MGATVDAQNIIDSPYVQAVADMRGIFMRRSFSPWKCFDTLFQFSDDYKQQTKCLEIIHGFAMSVINKKKKEKQAREAGNKVADDDLGIKKRMAFLDLLLESKIDGRDWTDEEIREEVDTFMFEVRILHFF